MSIPSKKTLLLVLSVFCCSTSEIVALTTLLKSDPDPVFNTLDPQTFLYTRRKLMLKGYDIQPERQEYFNVSLSPYGQNANIGRDMEGVYTPIGDLDGKWDMLAVLYGNLPQGRSYGPLLTQAIANIFPGGIGLNNPDYIDKNELIGFFTNRVAYRKRGFRIETDARIVDDFGISIQTGIADICQTVTAMINLTPDGLLTTYTGNSACEPGISTCNINKYLMDQIKLIAQEICLDIDNFHTVSIEEVRLNGFWRHAFEINKHDDDWPEFLWIPFAQVSGSISPGKMKNPDKAFGVPFGNNRHYSAGFNAGMNFDFYDTIEIGGEIGYTHFFKRGCVELRVPNSPCQTGIYPFSTFVDYQPGDNWNFGAKLSAYHFIDRLSGYFQYMLIEHRRDKICLINPDPAFLPDLLEDISDWKVQLANVGFNYDISPNFSLGFLWQAPLSQRNVYKSTTVMFSVNMTY